MRLQTADLELETGDGIQEKKIVKCETLGADKWVGWNNEN
jgi:hypothetical protein